MDHGRQAGDALDAVAVSADGLVESVLGAPSRTDEINELIQ